MAESSVLRCRDVNEARGSEAKALTPGIVRPRGLASASRPEIAASASRVQASAWTLDLSLGLEGPGLGLGLGPSGLVNISAAKYRAFGHLLTVLVNKKKSLWSNEVYTERSF